jgi:indolepyruvate ferredoxin oxidoreductase alpha subunit
LAHPPTAPRTGELSVEQVARFLGARRAAVRPAAEGLPPRPPALCPGCGHRALLTTLKKLNVTVFGDIGCYTLGVQPPLQTMHTCVCMGASIGLALGAEKATGRNDRSVAVIGDSTFVHSGITPLIDVVYNQGATTVIILDNETTAMTGHQDHPATGTTAGGRPTARLDLEALCRAAGVQDVAVVDPYDLEKTRALVSAALASPAPSVIIARRRCVLLDRRSRPAARRIDAARCAGCGACLAHGCPAIVEVTPAGEKKKRVEVASQLCAGCAVCAQLCPRGAIESVER